MDRLIRMLLMLSWGSHGDAVTSPADQAAKS